MTGLIFINFFLRVDNFQDGFQNGGYFTMMIFCWKERTWTDQAIGVKSGRRVGRGTQKSAACFRRNSVREKYGMFVLVRKLDNLLELFSNQNKLYDEKVWITYLEHTSWFQIKMNVW